MTKQLRLILTSFFPRLRREFYWQDLWPLAAFLAVFCGVCAWLESAHHLMFSPARAAAVRRRRSRRMS